MDSSKDTKNAPVVQAKPAVFLHIQKTAGTSIVQAASQYYGSNLVSHGDFTGKTPEDFRGIAFISGHFGYEFARPFLGSRVSFTFLREPCERVLSFYYFCLGRNPGELPIYEIAQRLDLGGFLEAGFQHHLVRERIWNSQVWRLACGYPNPRRQQLADFSGDELLEMAIDHLDSFTHVGLTETFDVDRAIIFAHLGLPLPTEPLVVNKTERRPGVADISTGELDLLRELTQLDRVLYDELRSRRRN